MTYDQKLIDFANAEMVFAGGGRSSLKRARAAYANDQALFCKVLDTLCLGALGSRASFAAIAEDASAMAVVAATPDAWRLVCAVDEALSLAVPDAAAIESLISSGGQAAANVMSGDSVSAMADNPTALSAMVGSGTALGMAAGSARAMAAICSRRAAMGAFAKSAQAIKAVARSDEARTAWMSSRFRDAFYDDMLATVNEAEVGSSYKAAPTEDNRCACAGTSSGGNNSAQSYEIHNVRPGNSLYLVSSFSSVRWQHQVSVISVQTGQTLYSGSANITNIVMFGGAFLEVSGQKTASNTYPSLNGKLCTYNE